MADGSTKPISRIKVGDKVLATNPLTGTQSARRVTHVWVHQDLMIRLIVAGEVLVTTEDHPFWNATDHTWERADAFDHGDVIATADGRIAKYRRFVGRFWRTTAYNLTVQGVHTYHVGARGLLVHNCDLTALARSGADKINPKSDLSRAASSLNKHGGQTSSLGGAIPLPASGAASVKNQFAQELLEDILTAPGTRTATIQAGSFKGGKYFIAPDGRLAAYDKNGVFQYFGVAKR
jgi:hypothetical protein